MSPIRVGYLHRPCFPGKANARSAVNLDRLASVLQSLRRSHFCIQDASEVCLTCQRARGGRHRSSPFRHRTCGTQSFAFFSTWADGSAGPNGDRSVLDFSAHWECRQEPVATLGSDRYSHPVLKRIGTRQPRKRLLVPDPSAYTSPRATESNRVIAPFAIPNLCRACLRVTLGRTLTCQERRMITLARPPPSRRARWPSLQPRMKRAAAV